MKRDKLESIIENIMFILVILILITGVKEIMSAVVKNEQGLREVKQYELSENVEHSIGNINNNELNLTAIEDKLEDKDGANNDNISNELYNISVVKINVADTGKDYGYEINGSDIVYNNVTYKYLKEEIGKLKGLSEYSEDTLIKLIINMANKSKEYNVSIELENGGYGVSLDDELSDTDRYKELKEKYNEAISYSITIRDNKENSYRIIGCSKYTLGLQRGSNINIEV